MNSIFYPFLNIIKFFLRHLTSFYWLDISLSGDSETQANFSRGSSETDAKKRIKMSQLRCGQYDEQVWIILINPFYRKYLL